MRAPSALWCVRAIALQRFYRSLAGQQDFWARFWGCRAEEAGAVHEARGTCAEEQHEVIFLNAPCWWKLSGRWIPGGLAFDEAAGLG